jgi:hypothetical protein
VALCIIIFPVYADRMVISYFNASLFLCFYALMFLCFYASRLLKLAEKQYRIILAQCAAQNCGITRTHSLHAKRDAQKKSQVGSKNLS